MNTFALIAAALLTAAPLPVLAQAAAPTPQQQQQDDCPGLTLEQINQIARGRRVVVLAPGCEMKFN
jgi:hypothetical protein